MKVRIGFVTNSSSSSYIIGVHGELTEEKLWRMFGVKEGSLFAPFAKELVRFIVRDAQKYTKEEALVERDELWGVLPKIFDSGMTCYIGWASDQDSSIENALCEMEIHYEDENLILEKEGSY